MIADLLRDLDALAGDGKSSEPVWFTPEWWRDGWAEDYFPNTHWRDAYAPSSQ